MATKTYWLMKSEPDVYSIDDLKKEKQAYWEGVRNFKARNNMREMKMGDGVLFYHSSTAEPAVVGVARVVRESYPDDTAWDPGSKYHDPKANPGNPIWCMVDIQAEEALLRPITLKEIKANPNLDGMLLVRQGMRLSIQPVAKAEWDEILGMARSG